MSTQYPFCICAASDELINRWAIVGSDAFNTAYQLTRRKGPSCCDPARTSSSNKTRFSVPSPLTDNRGRRSQTCLHLQVLKAAGAIWAGNVHVLHCCDESTTLRCTGFSADVTLGQEYRMCSVQGTRCRRRLRGICSRP